MSWTLWEKLRLIDTLVRREVGGRYRGTLFGAFWSLLSPLLMLLVYTIMFGVVYKIRWPGLSDKASMGEFAVILFSGLIVFQPFAEVINRAPTLITSNPNYVKKIVFPLEVLVPVALGTALFHAAISLVVLFVFMIPVHGLMPWTAVLLPVVVVPYSLSILGLGWFLASLGTYVRDIGQVLGTLVTALMFLSPIFFPSSALPEWLRPWLALNPVALPVEAARDLLVFGRLPNFSALAVYALVSLMVITLGYLWFAKTRRGFADVL